MHSVPIVSALFRPDSVDLSAGVRRQIQLYRLLTLLGVLLLPLFGLSGVLVPGTSAPIWGWLGAAGLLAGLFGASYTSERVRRHYVVGVRGILYLMMAGFAAWAAWNHFGSSHEASLLLVYTLLIMVVWAGARSMGPVLRFAGFGVLVTLAAAAIGPVPPDSALVVLASMGTVAAVECVIIQASVSTRKKLRDHEERLLSITENVSDGIYRSVPGEGIVYANQAFAEMFGYEHVEDLLQVDPAALYHDPEERGRRMQDLRTQHSFDAHEVEFQRKDGTTFTGLLSGTVVRGPEGEVKCYDGAIADITEQKEAEQTLRKEKAVLRRMYRITADRDESFESKIHRLLDLGREYLELPYGFLTRISEGKQKIMYASGAHSLLQQGATCPLSEAYCRKTIEQGSLLAVQDAPSEGWIEDPAYDRFELGSYIGAQVRLEEEDYGTFCFAADKPRKSSFSEREKTFVELLTRWASYELEQRRNKERLQRKNERLDSFAGVLSHDLRNPLNTAMMNLDLAREADDPRHLTDIGRALDRMRRIIQDVLTLARNGDIDSYELSPVDLPSVAEASWSQVDTARATLRNEADATVHADEKRLKRLLENLFRNAVEHGGKEVVVRIGDLPTGFFIEDDGPGIPVEKREEVFGEGYSSNRDGTGLGLSIVETVADGHDWTLSITDGPAGGARFEVEGVDVVEKSLLTE